MPRGCSDTAYTRFPDGDVTFFAQERVNQQAAKQWHGVGTHAAERVDVMSKDNQVCVDPVAEPRGQAKPARAILWNVST